MRARGGAPAFPLTVLKKRERERERERERRAAWELGGLPPKIALQYYYDWGNMRGTGAIYGRLPRSYTLTPSYWEEMGARLIPSPDNARWPPPNPDFPDPNYEPGASSSGGATPGPAPHSSWSSWSPSPATVQGMTPSPQPDERGDDEDTDHLQLMQSRAHLGSSAASSSHGPRVLQLRGIPQLTGAAAMIRRWLREFAEQPMGDQVPLLLQQTMEAVGHDQETKDEGDNGTVGIPGPCKKRRILNMLYVARVRLQDVCDDEGLDGDNQHQIRADLETALRDIDGGAIMFEQMTARQWGDQVQQGHYGIAQARKAVQAALESTIQGDLDWVTPGWGEAIGLILQDAEELMDEEGRLDWAHPADVLALDEGAAEAPPVPQGDVQSQIDTLLRNVGAVAHFLRKGRDELRRFLAAVIVWRQANHGMGGIHVDTQTTEEGGEPGPGDPAGDLSGAAPGRGPGDPTGDSSGAGPTRQPRGDPVDATKWIPPLTLEQWPGSIPTEDSPQSGPEPPVSPTDDDLVQALEDYERQAEQERLAEAKTEEELGDTALDPGASSTEGHEEAERGEHRRRRFLAAGLEE